MRIGNREVGRPVFTIAEIGINHNGSLDNCRKLIAAAAIAGFDAVKFQTRTVEVVYSPDELEKPREHPWGATNGDLKRHLELSIDDYASIDVMCEEHGIMWFASCWDSGSVDRIEILDPPCYKIASACLTDHDLIRHTCETGKPIILSTGMSTAGEVDAAVAVVVDAGNELLLMHCTSTYPSQYDELNLRCIQTLQRLGVPVGYSGHEPGLTTTFAAVALGAVAIERHVTLDRTMFGSDQAASIEPQGMMQLIKGIRTIEQALGDGIKRVYDSELPIREKLRRCNV